MKTALQGHKFDVVYDLNGACCPHRHCSSSTPHPPILGREAVETQSVLDACPGVEQYIYCSSAGVYLKSDQMPHMEGDAVRCCVPPGIPCHLALTMPRRALSPPKVDPKSRHKGKLETEALLEKSGVNYTSVRPVRPFRASRNSHRRLLTYLSFLRCTSTAR